MLWRVSDDRITPKQFHSAEGVEDWRVLADGARARFVTGSFRRGADLVAEIAVLADDVNHHPDVELRYGSVDVCLTSHDVGDISERDGQILRGIADLVAGLSVESEGASADPLSVGRQLVALVMNAPAWVRRTGRLSPSALRVRNLAIAAHDRRSHSFVEGSTVDTVNATRLRSEMGEEYLTFAHASALGHPVNVP